MYFHLLLSIAYRPMKYGRRVVAWLHWLWPILTLLGLSVSAQAQGDTDVPFITTPDNVTLAMLHLAGVTQSDQLIDLGSGDGRIVITAARRFGTNGLGVEIVPDLVARSRASAVRAGVGERARFEERDLFKTDLSAATVITMYLLPEVNLQLRPRLLALKPGTRVVSHDWDMGDWMPDQTLTVQAPDKAIGREKFSRLHLWMVPAPVEGLWCAANDSALQLQQRYQQVSGLVHSGERQWAVTGQLNGPLLRVLGSDGSKLRAAWSDGELQVQAASGAWNGLQGQRLKATVGKRCPSPKPSLGKQLR